MRSFVVSTFYRLYRLRMNSTGTMAVWSQIPETPGREFNPEPAIQKSSASQHWRWVGEGTLPAKMPCKMF